MKLPRRKILQLAAGAAALPAMSRIARAEAYPTRPVRLIVGYAPGGGNDILARLMSQWLSERLGQPFVVENRPGAATNIATEVVVKSLPDGYTLLLTSTASAINATLYDRLNFNFVRDISAIGTIMRGGWVMEVNPSVPAKTVPEFIAFAKANPGKSNFASSGTGAPDHMSGELFKMMAGGSFPVSRNGASDDRFAWWTSAGHVCQFVRLYRVHKDQQAAPARSDDRDAFGGTAGHPNHRRILARL
jgi:tripartite-type tricarboxylate transporter receptor subunit TctC